MSTPYDICHVWFRQLDGGSDMVTAQLIAAVASLLKRGWLESGKEERNAFFADLEAIVASSGSKGSTRRAWARILVVSCASHLSAHMCALYTAWQLPQDSGVCDKSSGIAVHPNPVVKGP